MSSEKTARTMTVKWEKFSGSTDVFAIRLSFSPDPDEGVAIDREDSASWGRLRCG